MHIQTDAAPQRLFKKPIERDWSLHLEQKGQVEERVPFQNNIRPSFFLITLGH